MVITGHDYRVQCRNAAVVVVLVAIGGGSLAPVFSSLACEHTICIGLFSLIATPIRPGTLPQPMPTLWAMCAGGDLRAQVEIAPNEAKITTKTTTTITTATTATARINACGPANVD